MTTQTNTQLLPELPEAIGEITGRRLSPPGTTEFWGYFACGHGHERNERVYTSAQVREAQIAAIAADRAKTEAEGPQSHQWDEDGERCLKCGDKDWMTGPTCASKPVDEVREELESMTRMFHAACADLGQINEALGLDPDDGGGEPILYAIEELKAKAGRAKRAPMSLTDEQVYAAIEAFNVFPCPMMGSVARSSNAEQMRSALHAALLASAQQVAPKEVRDDHRHICIPKNDGKPFVINRAPDSYELRECSIISFPSYEEMYLWLRENRDRVPYENNKGAQLYYSNGNGYPYAEQLDVALAIAISAAPSASELLQPEQKG